MYKKLISPIFDKFDSELGHKIAHQSLKIAESNPVTLKALENFNYKGERFTDKSLNVTLGGIKYENPLIVAAGWDKTGETVLGLYTLGFSAVEIGSVLANPQPGNPKPRQFMLAPGVALNRMGFNSPGMDQVALNLEKYTKYKFPIGISIGKNKEVLPKDAPEAHAVVAKKLYQYASYFVINVSSPNTPGLRELQDKKPLNLIVKSTIAAMNQCGGRLPLYVKIAPDLSKGAIADVIEVAMQNRLTGIIATNTTSSSKLKAKYGLKWAGEMGGLSGNDKEYRQMSTEVVAFLYKEAGKELEIIGVGGVKDTKTALEKIMAGATALQLLTALRLEGPAVAGMINRGLVDYMRKHKVKNITELVGVENKKYKSSKYLLSS